jgi:hypothetical protein
MDGRRLRSTRIALLGLLALAAWIPVGAVSASPGSTIPLAFQRTATRFDHLPKSATTMPSPHGQTRRVFLTVQRNEVWRLFAATTPAAASAEHIPYLCVLVMKDTRDEGTDCSSGSLDAAGRPVFEQSDTSKIDFVETDEAGVSLIYGIAANAARTLDVITPSGTHITLPLSKDHGFLYFCGHAGCACEIERIESFAATGRTLASDGMLASTWCPHR